MSDLEVKELVFQDTGDAAAEVVRDGSRRSLRSLVKGLLMIAILAAVGISARAIGLADALDTKWLDAEVVGQGWTGELLFIAIGAALAALGLPRQLVAFGGGYAFGLAEGTVAALIAQVFGCALAFFYARLLGRSLIRNRFGPRIRKVDDFLRGNPFTMTLLIRFLPVGSNLITNLAAGVSSVPGRAFLAGSAIGYVPQTVIFALLGTGIQVEPAFRISLSVLLFVLSGLLGAYLFRRMRRG